MSLIKSLKSTILEQEGSKGLEFKDFFSGKTSSDEGFKDHIYNSIPSYAEMEEYTSEALLKMYRNGALMLDIGASEGQWGKYVSKRSGGKIRTHNLDPNPDMKATFDKEPVKGAEYIQKAFGDGFEDNGEQIEGFKPEDQYDVVRESMTFQFISTNREEQYRLAKQALKSDGLFITNSKTHLPDKDEYQKYEDLKDEFKRKSFSDEEIEKKAKEVLPSMSKYMVDLERTFDALNKHFKYVREYWTSGNFHGFVASDSKQIINKFLSYLPDAKGFPNSVDGKVIDPLYHKQNKQ